VQRVTPQTSAAMRWLGIEVAEAADGRAVLTMTARPEMANRSEGVHGGFLALLADSAMGQAVSSALSETRRQASFDLKLSFIAPGRIGEHLEAVATVLHSGRRTGVADCRVTGEDGRLVATATATFIIF
jgi:acyl-CoA thioesterase